MGQNSTGVDKVTLDRKIRGRSPLSANALRSRFDKATELVGVAKAECQPRDLRAKAGTDTAEARGILADRKQIGHASVTMTE